MYFGQRWWWVWFSPLGPASLRSFRSFHFSQIVSRSLTGLLIGRGSSCCWSHPRRQQPFCLASQAFGTSPESEASKHKCHGLRCNHCQSYFLLHENDIMRLLWVLHFIQSYMMDEKDVYAWDKKLTKVDSCRLLFFRCFLCFFPSPFSPFSSFRPFCGTAWDQHR